MDKKPVLRAMLTTPEEDDDEERFVDAPDDDDDEENDSKDQADPAPTQQQPPVTLYDGRKRDPQYSNAEQTCLWELVIEIDRGWVEQPITNHDNVDSIQRSLSSFCGKIRRKLIQGRIHRGQPWSTSPHPDALFGSIRLPQCQEECLDQG